MTLCDSARLWAMVWYCAEDQHFLSCIHTMPVRLRGGGGAGAKRTLFVRKKTVDKCRRSLTGRQAQVSLVVHPPPHSGPAAVGSNDATPDAHEWLSRGNRPPTSSTNVTTAAATSPRMVMLQTASVLVHSQTTDTDRPVRARVLLDGGAQRTFITRSLAEKLSLPLPNDEQLSISTSRASTGTSSSTCEF